MQHIPSSMRMVLVFPGADISLDSLYNMADRITEVAAPSVAADHAPATHSADAAMDYLSSSLAGTGEISVHANQGFQMTFAQTNFQMFQANNRSQKESPPMLVQSFGNLFQALST